MIVHQRVGQEVEFGGFVAGEQGVLLGFRFDDDAVGDVWRAGEVVANTVILCMKS